MDNYAVANAMTTVNQLIPLVEEAEAQFKSARNWSFLDIFGGGFIIDLIKHHKLGKASQYMNEVDRLLHVLASQLGQINIPDDYRMQMNGFVTFADFMFDGIFVDAYMTHKIMSSLEQVRQLKDKLYILRERLFSMR
ncbi:hypothetical protein [Treponema sp.]|uniref:hypothetical protein n=1 Tax=Treponema sp. TaxID=166 RepID=UPI0025CF13AA|nr:hypothetical protein [Treponema sp.]MCR5217884.1 hypothetical protein [Treponema sp.]